MRIRFPIVEALHPDGLRRTKFDSLGRNGFLMTTGDSVDDLQIDDDQEYAEVHIRPINSRGDVTRACQVVIRRDAIPRLIEVLQAYLPPTLKERLLAERKLYQKWLQGPALGDEPGEYEWAIKHIDWRLTQSDIA